MNEILAEISDLALTLFTICSLGAVGLSMTVPQIVEPLRNARLLIRLLIGNFLLIPLLGVVLNDVSTCSRYGYAYYHRYYHYGYGRGYYHYGRRYGYGEDNALTA